MGKNAKIIQGGKKMKTLNKKEENSIEAWVSLIWYNDMLGW